MVYLWKVQHQQRPKECEDICVCTYTHERTNPIPCLFPEQLTSCNQKILYFVCVKEIRWVLDMAVHHCRVIGYLCEIIKYYFFSIFPLNYTFTNVSYDVFYFMFLFNHSLHHNLVSTFFLLSFLKNTNGIVLSYTPTTYPILNTRYVYKLYSANNEVAVLSPRNDW